jgi:hypothetical protein
MAASGNLTLNANVTGGSDGARSFGPITIVTNAAVTQTMTVTLAIGANTITLPSGVTAMVISPPNAVSPSPNPAYGGTVTVKGVAGDTGLTVSNKWPTLVSFDTSPASVVVTASAVGTLVVWLM